MNTDEIANALKTNPLTREQFCGVFPYDKIPTRVNGQNPSYFVFNFDPSTEEGSHWVAVKLHPKKKNVYFDSYGLPPGTKTNLKRFMDKQGEYEWSAMQLQHPLSTTCGQWCLLFIHEQCKGDNLRQFISHFTRDLSINDYEMNTFVQQIFDINEPVRDSNFLQDQLCRQHCQSMSQNVCLFKKRLECK